jgi:hypothetical protein
MLVSPVHQWGAWTRSGQRELTSSNICTSTAALHRSGRGRQLQHRSDGQLACGQKRNPANQTGRVRARWQTVECIRRSVRSDLVTGAAVALVSADDQRTPPSSVAQ